MEQDKKYSLVKDLPNAKAGCIYTYNKSLNVYCNARGEFWRKEFVEDNPEWFKEVVENGYVVSLKSESVLRTPITQYDLIVGNSGIPQDKMDAVIEAINKVLSNDASKETFKLVEEEGSKKEKDYEILTCYSVNKLFTHNYISEINNKHRKTCEKQGCKISSVKRLFDNTIWTLGDNTEDGKILGFVEKHKTIFVEFNGYTILELNELTN